ncbi:MAG: TetR/AcrR family transcriptional regulator [Isosphaeraceae bacterium]|nr:TetR/AcrR family transcriptional regulator [Isosphaeraceae bacterium]
MARHIATVAARLFAARGYDATPVREIVEAAGVTKPTLYYHFQSKEGLGHALLTKPLGDLLDQLAGILASDLPARELLAAIFEAKFAFCREDPDRARFVYALLFGPLAAGLADEVERLGCALESTMVAASTKLAEAGAISAESVAECASACRGMIVVSTIDYLYKGRELDAGLASRLVDRLLEGFALRAAHPSVEESGR